jgi:ubiquinone/menaquinone biosynthesis C-methylase UbiE
MSTPDDQAQSENTYIIDPESGIEMARLMYQDKLITQAMGGLLEDIPRASQARRILDVACGPGSWALEVAFNYPKVQVVGFDLSNLMIQYANAQAKAQRLSNARFLVMDARKPLEFPDGWFDIVNARFISGFMRKEDWPKLVGELVRITRPGGVVRLTESNDTGITNSPALEKCRSLLLHAGYVAGMVSIPNPRHAGYTPMLGRYLLDAGCQDIQERAYIFNYSAGTKEHASNYENFKIAGKLTQPFLLKMGIATQEELDKLYAQMLVEMIQKDFRAHWFIVSVSGEKPPA